MCPVVRDKIILIVNIGSLHDFYILTLNKTFYDKLKLIFVSKILVALCKLRKAHCSFSRRSKGNIRKFPLSFEILVCLFLFLGNRKKLFSPHYDGLQVGIDMHRKAVGKSPGSNFFYVTNWNGIFVSKNLSGTVQTSKGSLLVLAALKGRTFESFHFLLKF